MRLHKLFEEKFQSQKPAEPLKLPPEKLRPFINQALEVMFADNEWRCDREVEIEDQQLPSSYGDVRCRFYIPPQSVNEKLPLYVHLHGGGWWLGTVESLDPLCKEMAFNVPCIVVSVEYSLSPEATFPQAPEEIYQVIENLVEQPRYNYDVSRIAIGGNSAGANLAAAVCLMARDRSGPVIKCQWLDSPATDFSCRLPSYKKNATGFMLTGDSMRDAWGWYLKDNDGAQAYASPLKAKLNSLPPALVLTAEYDPLCDDGRLYAYELKKAGVEVDHFHYPGMVHGFMGFRPLSQSEHAWQALLAFLRRYLF